MELKEIKMEQLALTCAGAVTPFIVQFIRKYLGDVALKDWVAQLIVFGVSLVLAIGAGAFTGELGNATDVITAAGAVFAVSTVVYKSILQDLLDDKMLEKDV